MRGIKAKRAAARKERAETPEGKANRLFFEYLNGELKRLGFCMENAELQDPLHPLFNYGLGELWPLPHLMTNPHWRTQNGKRIRGAKRYFEIAGCDKRDFAALAIKIAKEQSGNLIANDGHPTNQAKNWQFDQYVGPDWTEEPE